MNFSIDGSTQLYGLIGQNIAYSLSPAMQNAAFTHHQTNAVYLPWHTTSQNFDQCWQGLVALQNFHGANITIPFKTKAYQQVDHLTPEAQQIGAINTVKIENGITIGTNTDSAGFLAPLHAQFPNQTWQSALIVGAGGAARAVLVALATLGCQHITLLNRTLATAQALIQEFQPKFPHLNLQAIAYHPHTLVQLAQSANLLVNCTPIGISSANSSQLTFDRSTPLENSIWPFTDPIPQNLVVYDLIYNPQHTFLAQQAQKSNAPFIGGLEMLIHQGALSLEFWTGIPAPIEQMRVACQTALTQQTQSNLFTKE
jgi:shikimate dehydrogenase